MRKDSESGLWFEIGDDRAHDKVGHAIRKSIGEIKRKVRKESRPKRKSNKSIDDTTVKVALEAALDGQEDDVGSTGGAAVVTPYDGNHSAGFSLYDLDDFSDGEEAPPAGMTDGDRVDSPTLQELEDVPFQSSGRVAFTISHGERYRTSSEHGDSSAPPGSSNGNNCHFRHHVQHQHISPHAYAGTGFEQTAASLPGHYLHPMQSQLPQEGTVPPHQHQPYYHVARVAPTSYYYHSGRDDHILHPYFHHYSQQGYNATLGQQETASLRRPSKIVARAVVDDIDQLPTAVLPPFHQFSSYGR